MTGEMHWINQDGVDSNGDAWPLHAIVARAVGGELKPFDSYQGPYIVVGKDIAAGNAPYRVPIRGLGCIRLWVYQNECGEITIWREDNNSEVVVPFDDEETIADCARALLNRQ